MTLVVTTSAIWLQEFVRHLTPLVLKREYLVEEQEYRRAASSNKVNITK